MTQTKTPNLSALTDRIDAFPTLPTVAVRVMEITANPESSSKELMKVISHDQSLAAAILKMANSPFFGLVKEVSSIQHALTVLGYTEIRNLVLTKTLFNSFKNLRKDSRFDIGGFWEHSLSCGLAAKIIAADLKGDTNDFFMAGLIHDIGKLIIYMALPMEFSEIIETAGPLKHRMFEAEKDILGVTHEEVGMMLLKRWMFPENLLTAVGFHHRPCEAKKESLFPLVVHAADLLTYLNESPDDKEAEPVLSEELFCSEIIDLSRSHGLKWDEAALERFQEELVRRKEEEAETLASLLS